MIDWSAYHIQILETMAPWGLARHLVVERCDGKGGVTWDELQEIKDETLGAESCAIEFYPPADEVVNEVNRRHLWEVPPDIVYPLLSR